MVINESPRPSPVLWLLIAILLSSILLLICLIVPGVVLSMLYEGIINLDLSARFRQLSTPKIIIGLTPVFAFTLWEAGTLWQKHRNWQQDQRRWVHSGIIALQNLEQSRQNLERVQGIVSKLKVRSGNAGFIYVMRRSDGIYKLGQAIDTEERLKIHTADYGMGFTLVKRFVVPDKMAFEKLALKMTAVYHYYEPGRIELRQMTDEQLTRFLAEFYDICMMGVDL